MALEHAATELRGIARVLSDALARTTLPAAGPRWVHPAVLGGPLGRLLGVAAGVLEELCAGVEAGPPSAPARPWPAFSALVAAHRADVVAASLQRRGLAF